MIAAATDGDGVRGRKKTKLIMEKLNLDSCLTNQDVVNKVKSHVSSMKLSDLIEELSEDFVYQDEAIRKIYVALAAGKNSILYGAGGFGKSVIVKAVCKALGLPVTFKVGHAGMTAEELLGVPNMKKLLKDSEYEVAFENSVFSQKKILVLEEFGDVDPSVVAVLKDIITSRGFIEGDKKKESFVPNIIITSNKTPDELSTDDSTSAFYKERFPIRHHVKWDLMESENYLDFFKVYYKENYYLNFYKFKLLAELCEKTNTAVSPRIAAEAGDVILELGIEYIDTIEDIDTSELVRWIKEAELEVELTSEIETLENINTFISKLPNQDVKEGLLLKNQFTLIQVRSLLLSQRFSDGNIPRLKSVLSTIEGLQESNIVVYNKITNNYLKSEIEKLTLK